MLLIFSILALISSLVLTFMIVVANGMSSSPSTPFQGGWLLLAAWAFTALLWAGWWFGW